MKWSELTYKKRLLLLIAGFVLAFICSWNFAISKTVSKYAKMNELHALQLSGEDLPIQKAVLEQQAKQLRFRLGKTNIDVNKVRVSMIAFCDSVVKNSGMRVDALYPLDRAEIEGFEVTLHQLKVQGEYAELEALSNAFDAEFDLGRLAAVRYSKEYNRKKRKNELYALYTIQNIHTN